MFQLPQELTDKIIDCLHDDEPSLGNCSLVCWAWVPATRFHIFSNITLRRKWKRLMYPQYRPFVDMLATETCTFAPFVTRLTCEADLDPAPEAVQEFASAFSVLSKLTSVASLTFDRWRNLGITPMHNLLPHLTALSEITLIQVTIDSADQLFSMLEMCPSLTSLAVETVSWGPSSSPVVYSRAGSIRKLRLVLSCMYEVLDIFAQAPSKLICDTVELRPIVPQDIQSIGRFLDEVAGSLRHLAIGFTLFHGTDIAELFCSHIDLRKQARKQTRLTTFRLADLVVLDLDRATAAVISTMKYALAFPQIEEMIFSLTFSNMEHLGGLQWDQIDDVLSSAQLNSSLRVEFCIEGWGDSELLRNTSRTIRKLLPRSSARHAVIFTV